MSPTRTNEILNSARIAGVSETFKRYKWYLIVPFALCTVLAIGYALVAPKKWQATQAVFVRDDISGQFVKPGRFDSLDAMKTFQETILQTTRSNRVIREVLTEVGPESSWMGSGNWPTPDDIDSFRDSIKISAPNGAEFGQTEVLNFSVTSKSRERAILLTETLVKVVKTQVSELRNVNARSIANELKLAVDNAQKNVTSVTGEIKKIESEIGEDLAELRILTNAAGGSSTLTSNVREIKSELRSAKERLQVLTFQRDQLQRSLENPENLISTSTELLEAQPSLKKLKDGLIEAQLQSAKILGQFTEVHPKAMQVLETEEFIRKQIHIEISTSLKGLETQIKVATNRQDGLQSELDSLHSRLNMLARVRVVYGNLNSKLMQATAVLTRNKTQWDEAVAFSKASEASSLINTVDGAQTGSRPLGLARRNLVLIGMIGGLVIGIGLVIFVSAPTPQNRNVSPAQLTQETEANSKVATQSEHSLTVEEFEERTVENPLEPADFALEEDSETQSEEPYYWPSAETRTEQVEPIVAVTSENETQPETLDFELTGATELSEESHDSFSLEEEVVVDTWIESTPGQDPFELDESKVDATDYELREAVEVESVESEPTEVDSIASELWEVEPIDESQEYSLIASEDTVPELHLEDVEAWETPENSPSFVDESIEVETQPNDEQETESGQFETPSFLDMLEFSAAKPHPETSLDGVEIEPFVDEFESETVAEFETEPELQTETSFEFESNETEAEFQNEVQLKEELESNSEPDSWKDAETAQELPALAETSSDHLENSELLEETEAESTEIGSTEIEAAEAEATEFESTEVEPALNEITEVPDFETFLQEFETETLGSDETVAENQVELLEITEVESESEESVLVTAEEPNEFPASVDEIEPVAETETVDAETEETAAVESKSVETATVEAETEETIEVETETIETEAVETEIEVKVAENEAEKAVSEESSDSLESQLEEALERPLIDVNDPVMRSELLSILQDITKQEAMNDIRK